MDKTCENTISVDPEDLNNILKSFGRMIDSHKYLRNACEVQSNISDGTIYNFSLSKNVCSIVAFLCNNSPNTDIDKLAKKYVYSQPKFAKKNKNIKKLAYQEAKNKINSEQVKKLFSLTELVHKYVYYDYTT